MELIEKRVLGSALSEVNFTGPWSAYTDIEIYLNLFFTSSASPEGVKIQFNGDTGANYNIYFFETTGGSGVNSNGTVSDTSMWVTYRPSGSTDVPLSGRVRLFDVNSTDIIKTSVSRYGGIEGYGGTYNGAWKNTNALSSFKFIKGIGASNFLTGSTFLVYGVKA
jgi:hypothetical protein